MIQSHTPTPSHYTNDLLPSLVNKLLINLILPLIPIILDSILTID